MSVYDRVPVYSLPDAASRLYDRLWHKLCLIGKKAKEH